MRPYGPAPLLATILLTVGAGQILQLPEVQRRLERDEMAQVRSEKRSLRARPDADLLLMGNSRMEAAVDPDALASALGLRPGRVQNLGVRGGTFSQQVFRFREWLARPGAPPRTVVLAVSPVDLSAHFPGRTRASRYLHDLSDLLPLLRAGRFQAAGDLLDGLLLPAYRFRTEIKDVLKRAPPAPLQTESQRAERAALPPEQRELRQYTEDWLKDFEVDEDEAQSLEEMESLAHAAGIRLILLRLPVCAGLLEHERRVAGGRFEALLGNAPYLDLATPEAARAYGFEDCNHLDARGRAAFTPDLARALVPWLEGIGTPSPRP